MTTKCTHKQTRELATRCFRAPVGPIGDQNRAAHGGVCATVECLACGARRQENHNGCHEELGHWGASRDERERAAAQAERAARNMARPEPVSLSLATRSGEALWTVQVSVDQDGMFVADDSRAGLRAEDIAAAAPDFAAAALRLRRQVLRAQELRAEV